MENTQTNYGKISVIIPMYNVEKYLTECVESIEKQTYQNFEIILVDDGSCDNTYEVAQVLATRFNNIILHRKDNGGQASARNVGLMLAKGDYISFIDSDDYIDENMFDTMIKIASDNSLDIIECCYQDVFCETRKKGNKYFLNYEIGQVYSGRDFYELKPSLSPCDKLYKRTYLESIDFKCTENHYAEDAYDTTYAILMAKRISHINEVFYFYRRDNLGSTRNNQSIERRIKLGEDKLFIANKLNNLRAQLNIKGYLSTIIVRNTAGTILCPIFIKNRIYRKAMIECFKKNCGMLLIKENISLPMFIELFGVGVRKLLTKGD